MATYVTPKRATAFRTWVSLASQAAPSVFQTNPTLAAGDVKVSKDGGALANITTLPVVTPAGSTIAQVDLSAAEMTADVVTVVFADVAGAEWCSLTLVIPTTARQIDDLAYPLTTGRGLLVDASGFVTTVGITIKKNAALAAFEFPMYNSSDHVTPQTGLTVTAQRSIDGAAFANCANAAAEVGSGIYKIDLAAADLNGNVITLKFTATGGDTTFFEIVTQTA